MLNVWMNGVGEYLVYGQSHTHVGMKGWVKWSENIEHAHIAQHLSYEIQKLADMQTFAIPVEIVPLSEREAGEDEDDPFGEYGEQAGDLFWDGEVARVGVRFGEDTSLKTEEVESAVEEWIRALQKVALYAKQQLAMMYAPTDDAS